MPPTGGRSSTTTTLRPDCRVSWKAMLAPMMPAPTTTMSAAPSRSLPCTVISAPPSVPAAPESGAGD